ncbi:hypothetical protein GE061_008223 [Apolygus lucorum]|uniref:Uncharacterized protein n=1 Tax=Apolygus lucorum TaxID=248454 RepID=A0A6A4IYR9_APOLU|nr:hypothetical protein GE061_008223 [Apolygus lucorum]
MKLVVVLVVCLWSFAGGKKEGKERKFGHRCLAGQRGIGCGDEVSYGKGGGIWGGISGNSGIFGGGSPGAVICTKPECSSGGGPLFPTGNLYPGVGMCGSGSGMCVPGGGLYPPQNPGFPVGPPRGQYPPTITFLPQQRGGYPPSITFPPQQQGGYPPSITFPPQQQGGYPPSITFPPQQQGGYPPSITFPPQQQGGYPPSITFPPQQPGVYPPILAQCMEYCKQCQSGTYDLLGKMEHGILSLPLNIIRGVIKIPATIVQMAMGTARPILRICTRAREMLLSLVGKIVSFPVKALMGSVNLFLKFLRKLTSWGNHCSGQEYCQQPLPVHQGVGPCGGQWPCRAPVSCASRVCVAASRALQNVDKQEGL